MAIALDSYYTIGKLHLFCEDYVYQGSEPFPHIILADGCSASPDSDVGARLLVLNARCLLPQFITGALDEPGRIARHGRLGQRIVRRAARQVRELGLELDVLDATLLIAWCDGTTVYVHLYGDGCIAACRADGGIAAIQVSYAENAPYFLSYLLDRERWALYREAVGDSLKAQSIEYFNETGVTTRLERFDAPTMFSFSLTSFPTVAVTTDGLHSFVNAETGEQMELLAVAREVLDFSSLNGDFVKRQLRKVLVEYSRQLVFNLDDLSVGAFVRTD
ncbi:MAG: protein phosphatase 2C domain-containing protein [Candidatus Competibacteraceae bacterium]